ncbi:S-layer homology domain-containing protein [Saccharibacillus sacchari]|uniref:S-layer homology domain-containing protein n=1 Tax=Saccharibacillus sacchari TaxID=456493 RepID=A0ACC6PFE5_9BACL
MNKSGSKFKKMGLTLAWLSTLGALWLGSAHPAHAEGSRDLVESGKGERPFTEWAPGTYLAGIERITSLQTYVKVGETMYLGSSVPTSYNGEDIVVTKPDGSKVVRDVIAGGAGLIDTVAKEKSGPYSSSNTGGYTPLTVAADQTGWWTIQFHGPGSGGNPGALAVSSNDFYNSDKQQNINKQQGTVAAWDITVKNADGEIKDGRTYTNYLSLNMGGGGKYAYSKLYVLTKDGYQYETDLNGIDPFGFGFFSNNRGFLDGSNATLYRSVNLNGSNFLPLGGVTVQNPTKPDTATDQTHRIFFNRPSADLPADVPTEPLSLAQLEKDSLKFVGTSSATTSPGVGGTFSFKADKPGSYQLVIDTDLDGTYDAAVDRVLENTFVAGENEVKWDGKDRAGAVLAEGHYPAKLTVKGGEYHFPMLDIESAPNGIKIKALNQPSEPALPNGVTPGTIYWNDSNYKTANGTNISLDPTGTQIASKPRDASSGIDSSAGARGFDKDYGNNKGIDTWTYFPGPSYTTVLNVKPEVSGTVFKDNDGNGQQDAGEPFYEKIMLTITNGGGMEYKVWTDAAGRFSFPSGSGKVTLRLDRASSYDVTTSNAVQTVTVASNASQTFAAIGLKSKTTAAPYIIGLSAASDSGSSSADGITNVSTPQLKGTAEPDSQVTVYDSDGTTVLATATADDLGNWVATTSPLANGTHTLTAKAQAPVKEISPASSGYSIVIDTIPPASIAVSNPQDGSVIDFDSQPIAFEGTAEAGSQIRFSADNGITYSPIDQAGQSGSWKYAFPSKLEPGTYRFSFAAQDTAGNRSAVRSVSVTVKAAPAYGELGVNGLDSVTIPEANEPEATTVYQAVYGETESPVTDPVSWSLEPTAPQGVTIDPSTGELRVSPSAPEGSVTVKAALSSDPTVAGSRTVTLKKAPIPVVLGSVTGTVYSHTGGTVAGVTVWAGTPGNEQAFSALSDANGQYRLDALPTGNYVISARSPQRVLDSGEVTVRAESERLDLHLAEVAKIVLSADPDRLIGDGQSTAELKASVVDALTGKPIEGVRATLSADSGKLSAEKIATDADGNAQATYTAPKIDSDRAVQETVTLIVREPKSGIYAEKRLTISLLPPSINGIVTSGGKAIAGALVKIAEDLDGDGIVDFTAEVRTAADGTYHIPVPRGNRAYTLHVEAPIEIGGAIRTVKMQQRSEVGALNQPGEEVAAIRQISGQLFVQKDENVSSPFEHFVRNGSVSGTLLDSSGQTLSSEVKIDAEGGYQVDDVQPGTYRLLFKFEGPSGEKLAGVFKDVTVDQEGQLTIEPVLIDPYGIVTDSATGKAVEGVDMRLYWADTALNRSQGRTPDTEVPLPELADFAPNRNRNPQLTVADGSYAWMVYANGDYYIKAVKSGYETYDSRIEKRNRAVVPGEDSWIDNGIIHVGSAIVEYDLSMNAVASVPTPAPAPPVAAAPVQTPVTTAVVPAVPSEPSVANVAIGGYKLTWKPSTGASSYRVYIDGRLAASDVKLTEYWLGGLQAGNGYRLQVSAVSSAGESALSAEILWTAPEQGAHIHYIFGYPDGTFRPERSISRAEMAAIMTRIMIGNEVPQAASGRYADVQVSHWAAGYVGKAADLGVMNGTPSGMFQPERAITRGELAVIMARFRNLEPIAGANFSDTAGHWADGYIRAAAEAGLLKGYTNGTFRPDEPIARAELVTAVNRMLGRGPLLGELNVRWPDAPASYWAFRDIMEASVDHDYVRENGGEYWTEH